MNARGIAAALSAAMLVSIGAACAPAGGSQGAATPLPVVLDQGGVKAEGRLEPIRFVELAPVVSGVVSEVLVSEGTTVAAGDLLVRLDTTNGQTLEFARNEVGG